MAVITASATGGNWSATTAWVGGVVPTVADDVLLTGSSGNITLNATATNKCKTLVCTGYTGTLTLASGQDFTIAGNTLTLVSGMTLTLSGTVGTFFLTDTVNEVCGITTGGKSMPQIACGGGLSSSSTTFKLLDNFTSAYFINVTCGTLDFNGVTANIVGVYSAYTNVRALKLGSSSITCTGSGFGPWNIGGANMTVTAGTSTLTFTGGSLGFQSTAAYNNVIFSGGGNCQPSGGSYVNLTYIGGASKTGNIFNNLNPISVSGTFTVTGNSAINRAQIASNFQTITTGTSVVWSNVDCYRVSLSASFNASAITGGCGDMGGNTNITFTAPSTQTWSGTSGGNWSANAWTTRVPLAQDDVVISSAFSASQTITADMPNLGRSINWTGSTGSPTWAFNATTNTIYGSLTLIAGMTISGTNALTFAPAASYVLTTAGLTFTQALILGGAGSGTLTLAGNLTTNSTITQSLNALIDAGYSVSCTTYTGTGGSIAMTGAWSLTSTAASAIWSNSGGVTMSGTTGSITIINASANSRTFVGGGKIYGTLTYTVAGSTGALVVSGSNTFTAINFSDATNARTLTFTSSTTTTVATFNVNGTAAKLMTINATTPGTAASLVYNGTTLSNLDYLNIQDSTPTTTQTWFAGRHSTLVSNTGNWAAGTAYIMSQAASLTMSGVPPKRIGVFVQAGH